MTASNGSSTGGAGLPKQMWTTDDVADFFQVTDRQVRRWQQTDLHFPLPLALPGRTKRWDPRAIIAWATGQQEAA